MVSAPRIMGAAGNGRVAIVTGAGRGLGRAMALGLARAGVRVVATAAREPAEIEAVAAEGAAGRIVPLRADVTRAQDAQHLVAATLERFGRLDILVNNAGRGMKYVSETFMTQPTRFWEVEPETWRMVIDTLESRPDTSSCRSRQHLPYLGLCKPWGLQGPLGRFAVLRGAALRRVNGHPFAASAAQATPRASLPALSAVGTSFVRLTLYPGPRTGARDRTTLTCAAGRPASLRTQRRRGWRARMLRKWLIPAGSLASVLVPTSTGRSS